MSNTNNSARIEWLAVLQGFSMLLVVPGHISLTDTPQDPAHPIAAAMERVIYSFHMPLFIFISGWLFYLTCIKRDTTYTGMLRKKLTRLGIPFLFFTVNVAQAADPYLPEKALRLTQATAGTRTVGQPVRVPHHVAACGIQQFQRLYIPDIPAGHILPDGSQNNLQQDRPPLGDRISRLVCRERNSRHIRSRHNLKSHTETPAESRKTARIVLKAGADE